ncbi:MAG: cation transport protein ChaC [Parasphingorhabdus sp.]|jgi:cation transport protein ChaC
MAGSAMQQAVWVFGYGSIIWRPGFDYVQKARARLHGYTRRFWQGSHDHRGTPEAPGRVVTLVPESGSECEGVAFLIDPETLSKTFSDLDHREKNGYERVSVQLELDDGQTTTGIVYIAQVGNFAFLGDAPIEQIAAQIRDSVGPSGKNVDYVRELAEALRNLNIHDEHVFSLADQL